MKSAAIGNAKVSGSSFDIAKRIPLISLIASCLLISILMCTIPFFSSGALQQSGSLETNSIERLTTGMEVMGTFTATSENGDAAWVQNVSLAAEAINGKKVSKGSQFSFNSAIGDPAKDSRYQVATVYNASEPSSVLGGGVSQVSSALYATAIEAGMDIVERHPHAIAQDYVPLGLDSSVSFGELDFVFKNTTGHPIVIEATVSGGSVTVNIYGTPSSSGEEYRASSVIVDTVTAGNSEPAVTQYVVNTFRLVYKDGACIQRDLLTTDVYEGSLSEDPQAFNIES